MQPPPNYLQSLPRSGFFEQPYRQQQQQLHGEHFEHSQWLNQL